MEGGGEGEDEGGGADEADAVVDGPSVDDSVEGTPEEGSSVEAPEIKAPGLDFGNDKEGRMDSMLFQPKRKAGMWRVAWKGKTRAAVRMRPTTPEMEARWIGMVPYPSG